MSLAVERTDKNLSVFSCLEFKTKLKNFLSRISFLKEFFSKFAFISKNHSKGILMH